jgi:hypothetical protein
VYILVTQPLMCNRKTSLMFSSVSFNLNQTSFKTVHIFSHMPYYGSHHVMHRFEYLSNCMLCLNVLWTYLPGGGSGLGLYSKYCIVMSAYILNYMHLCIID